MKLSHTLLAGAAAAVALACGVAQAAPITFTASSGSLAAAATFSVSGSNLVVTLTNTSAADVLVPTDVLTAVFFNVAGNPTFTRVSGLLSGGSTVFYDGQPAGGVIGGEWAYKSGIAAHGMNEGISSTGVGIFGPGDRFPGPDLAPPTSPDGLQYGLLSAGDNTATGNPGGILGSGGLIKNQVTFELGNLPQGFDPSTAITGAVFQYGTALDDPTVGGHCTNCDGPPPPSVPEPMTLTLLGVGILGLGLVRRRR